MLIVGFLVLGLLLALAVLWFLEIEEEVVPALAYGGGGGICGGVAAQMLAPSVGMSTSLVIGVVAAVVVAVLIAVLWRSRRRTPPR